MKKELEPLFTPWKIGKCTIRNRIVLTSMGGTDLFGWMEKNHFDKDGARFILEAAKNNAGLVLPGCQPVYNPMLGQWLYKNEKMFQNLAAWMPEFHKTGAKLFIQLTAGFGRSFTISPLMETLYKTPGLNKLSKPFMDLDKITASASPSPNRWSDEVPSRELTIAEIEEYIAAFARTARLLKEAGVDGVEIHAVHEGYLLDQFTLKYVNHRTDRYGGSLENRYRFAAEIVKAIKNSCGRDFPVSLRYSVVSKTKGFRQGALPGETYTEAGRDMEESEQAVRFLQEAGYDMLNCDNGTYDAWYWAHPPIYMPENCNLEDVEHIKQFTDLPVVCAGRMDPYKAAEAIARGTLDGAGFARQFLADPKWVTKMIQEKEEDIRPCILCHNGCFNMCHYKGVPNDQALSDSLHLARCAVNAEMMQWDKHYIKKAIRGRHVAIVGGGIGGMEAARVLKLRGHVPVIFEKSAELGGTFIAASAESYKGKLRDLLTWYRRQMEILDIDVRLNTPIRDMEQLLGQFGPKQQPAAVIIATGAVPRKLKVPGAERMIEACEFLRGKSTGQKVAVIGGGLTGCEIAYELALMGKEPIIVEMKDDLISQKGVCLANSSYLREWFALHRVPVYLETKLKKVTDTGIICEDKKGGTQFIRCDSVISSAGYIPAPLVKAGAKENLIASAALTAKFWGGMLACTPAGAGGAGRTLVDKIEAFDPGEVKVPAYLVGDCDKVGNLRTVIWGAYEAAMKI